ncbi:MAG: divergent polysaccharide deacetylase family protein [Thiogranum sp.]|nr:divergent polysaccharide deacetylase family protein [Thiogranum sp.]
MMRFATGVWPVVLFTAFAITGLARAESTDNAPPAISIIIDDMGKLIQAGRRVIALPGPVACAFLPKERYTGELANAAFQSGKEVLLHLPMDSVDGRRLDHGAVTLDMTERQFIARVQDNLASVPHVTGVNNHMGSLLTRHPGHMLWLMREMRQQQMPLIFVDSRTTVATVARRVAEENDVPSTDRNVFLDNEPDDERIAYQFRRLLKLARSQGTALAIGHPYPQTLAFLERELPQLKQQGVQLLPVRALIEQQQESERTWQASLSPSHKAAKSSKPQL